MALRSLGRYDCKYSGVILDIRLGNLSITFSCRRNKAFVLYPKINLISSTMFLISNRYNDLVYKYISKKIYLIIYIICIILLIIYVICEFHITYYKYFKEKNDNLRIDLKK